MFMDNIPPNSSDSNLNYLTLIRILSSHSAILLLGLYLGELGYLKYVEPLLYRLTLSPDLKCFQPITQRLSCVSGSYVLRSSWTYSKLSVKQPSPKSEDLSARSGSNRR